MEVELAVCCIQQNSEMWDNNEGVNYSVRLEDLKESDLNATESRQNEKKNGTNSVTKDEK